MSIKGTVHPWQQVFINQILSLKRQGKLPHAILIDVRTQADSASLGWYLIQSLLCLSEEMKPCGHCKNCELMQANSYPDFTYTTLTEDDKTHKLSKFIKIDQIRKLIYQISLTDNLGHGKYALIYPAEKLNLASSNSLLKTLEEPPIGSTIVLLTHNPGKLPITIRSRCQKWTIQNPEIEIAKRFLTDLEVPSQQLDKLLQITKNDAQASLDIHNNSYLNVQTHINEQLSRYLNDELDVTSMVKSIDTSEPSTLRNVLKYELHSLINKELYESNSINMKSSLKGLLDILKKLEKSLHIEENNLNIQLQLEDVLISMKQNLNRG